MAAKRETKKDAGKAAPMTYESVRVPNLRYELQAQSRAKGGEVVVEAENTGKEK